MIEALNVNCKFHFSGFMSVMRERVFLPHKHHTHTHTKRVGVKIGLEIQPDF